MVPGSVLVPPSEAGLGTSVVAVVVVPVVAVDAAVGAAEEAGVAASPGLGTWRWRT